MAIRVEYFSNKNGVIIATGTPNGFKTVAFSLNADRKIGGRLLWRMEFRSFKSKDEIFIKGSAFEKNNNAITISLALTF
jgi:hypothetical protein